MHNSVFLHSESTKIYIYIYIHSFQMQPLQFCTFIGLGVWFTANANLLWKRHDQKIHKATAESIILINLMANSAKSVQFVKLWSRVLGHDICKWHEHLSCMHAVIILWVRTSKKIHLHTVYAITMAICKFTVCSLHSLPPLHFV